MRNIKILLTVCLLATAFIPAHAGTTIPVELYIMSQCPFGVQAGNGLFPALKSLEGSVELVLGYIADEKPGTDGKPEFQSMHGPGEVQEDIRQLCARNNYPGKWMDYVLAYNINTGEDWKPAAVKAGLNPEKLEACVTSGEGNAMFSDNIKIAKARGANASPTIYIADKTYNGGRGVKSFTLAICAALKATGRQEPEACTKALSLPGTPEDEISGGGAGGNGCGDTPPVKFDVQIVTDSACVECAPTLIDALKMRHPGAVIKQVDAVSPKGKALIAEHGAQALPLYILAKEVENEQSFSSSKAFYSKSGDSYIIKYGPNAYSPTVWLNRIVRPRHLDLFVNPLSPLTASAEDELFSLLRNPKLKDLTVSMHFILQEGVKADSAVQANQKADAKAGIRSASLNEMAEVSVGPLTSAQGAAGVKESRLQACLFQHISFGNYMAYLSCHNTALGNENQSEICLKPGEEIKKCVENGESERLLRQDAKTAKELGISSSNTAVLWENRYGPFEWNAVDLRRLMGVAK